MHAQLDELVAARHQMGQLLQLAVEIGSDLELDAVLHRIITSAMSMTGARYGALGVWGQDGTLASFVHTGVDPETVRRIGRLPAGKGVLGLLLNRAEPLRLDDLTEHPAAVGFPEHHPPMRAFLGVPITIRGNVYGSLYVADDRSGRLFTEADEVTARALASAAAVAINNARLFERVRVSAEWTEASREITTALLSGDPHVGQPLKLIVERARRLTEAEQAILLVPDDGELPAEQVDTLVVRAAVGLYADAVLGQRVPVEGSTTGGVFRSATPLITESFRHPIQAFTDVGQRPAVVMPLCSNNTVLGVIAVARNAEQPPFDTGYLGLISNFADHAAIALTLASARESEQELSVLSDRERIAHNLHDQVIQRLFAVGMDLQGTIARSHSPPTVQRLTQTVDDVQDIINEIRTTIFNLQRRAGLADGFRQRVQDAVADLTRNADIVTTLRLFGPLIVVGAECSDHAEAVLVEAISNAVRHSGATSLTVEVSVGDQLTLDIIDNGRGIPADNQRRSGLANMARRAEQIGGTCHITSPPDGGTHIHWTAPLIDQ
ncbi:MAG: GAF domain-containing sensor histidine kinase [Mycolicibacterium sp.]|nr:GAF domain-containing sensor histidine kinase [Mycolicibacterium sp.]